MKRLIVGVLLCVWGLLGCSGSPKTGPEEVRWDREICVRCLMAVSDHNFSAQVRGAEEGRKTKVYFFDDIGCAVLWLDKQEWKDEGRTEVWVNHWQDGSWVDARKSYFTIGHITPMDFQLGAQTERPAEALDFDQAVQHIHNRDQKAH